MLARPLPAVCRITDILYGPHPLAGGRSDALLHPCLLSSLERAWDPLPEKQGYLQTLERNTKDPFSVKPNGQSQLQISLEKRDHSTAEDDSRPLLPLSDAPAELPTNSSTAEDSRATWNNTLLDKLLSSPDQSLKQLEQMEGDNLCCSHLGLPVRDYFRGIHLYLREQEYSHFA